MWRSHTMSYPTLHKVKAILHLTFFTHLWSPYWKEQRRSVSRILRGKPDELQIRIRTGDAWAPAMSHSFKITLGLIAFNRMKIAGPADDATAATSASTISTITRMSVGGEESLSTLRSKLRAAEAKSKNGPGGGKEPNLPQDNPAYHMPLFLEFKKRKKDGKAIR